MLGYDVEKLNKELDREENSLKKKLAISSPVILYGSIVADKKALLSTIYLLLEASFETPVCQSCRSKGSLRTNTNIP